MKNKYWLLIGVLVLSNSLFAIPESDPALLQALMAASPETAIQERVLVTLNQREGATSPTSVSFQNIVPHSSGKIFYSIQKISLDACNNVSYQATKYTNASIIPEQLSTLVLVDSRNSTCNTVKQWKLTLSEVDLFKGTNLQATFVGNPVPSSDEVLPDFECRPNQYYSGGYDIYQIRLLKNNGPTFYEGRRYFQQTTGHGIKVGQPVLREVVRLDVTETSGHLLFKGFRSEIGESDGLEIPAQWQGNLINVNSRLFYNDYVTDGRCTKLQ